MQLNWVKCQGEVWCKLGTVNLNHAHFDSLYGVYIIWHGGPTPSTVYVGQGSIRECLLSHRTDPAIQQYSSQGLYVTWASVPQASLGGVQAFLINRLSPKVRTGVVLANPIEVNLPW